MNKLYDWELVLLDEELGRVLAKLEELPTGDAKVDDEVGCASACLETARRCVREEIATRSEPLQKRGEYE